MFYPVCSCSKVQRGSVRRLFRFLPLLPAFLLSFVWKACVAWESLERARRMDGGGPCSFPFVLRPRRLDPVYLHNKVYICGGGTRGLEQQQQQQQRVTE